MAYEMEDVKRAQTIYWYLLEHHELREADVPQLYRAYVESEEVRNLVKSQGEVSECRMERYGDVIYLIPESGNRFLGYTKAQLKKELCRSNATDKDYYLAQFAILVLLLEFYDGQGSTSRIRDYIRVGELQNSISEHLKEGAEQMDETDQDLYGIAYTQMLQAYESLRSSDRGNRQKTTKEGFLYHILRFLQEQGLIEYIEQDEMIRTTQKLDHFMDWNLLNQSNYDRVCAVIGGKKDEYDQCDSID